MLIRRVPGSTVWGLRDPWREFEQMRQQMDRIFDSLTGALGREPSAGVYPLINLTEDRDAYYVRAELPGMKPDDLEISVTANGLALSGERRIEAEAKDARYHRRERDGGKFSRKINFPLQIDPDKAEANCADGILTVTLPKAEAAKPKQIPVRETK